MAIGDGFLAITAGTALHVFAIDVDLSRPLPPTGLTATRFAGNQVTFRFMPPTAGAIPTGYVLEGGVLPGQVLTSIPLGPVPQHTISAPSGVFYVRVRSLAGGTVSAASNEIRIFVKQSVPPSPPTNLTGLVFGSSLRLAWKNTYQGGAVDRVTVDVTGPVSTSFVLGAVETFAFEGVPFGTFTFSVRAHNAAGESSPSSSVTLSFSRVCPGVPQAPTAFVAYRIGNTVQVAWDPPSSGTAPAGYVVNVSGPRTGSFPTTGRSLGGALGPGTYDVSVASTNLCGTGPATAVQTVVVP